MAGSTKFDSASFKQSTRDQWDHAAEAWNRWGSLLEQWCGEHTAKMLDMAGVQLGHRVVDIAAGAGGQSLAAALRVGSRGYVLGTDLSPTILAYAEQNARAFG